MGQARTSRFCKFKGRILINILCEGRKNWKKIAQWVRHTKFEKIAFLNSLKFWSKNVLTSNFCLFHKFYMSSSKCNRLELSILISIHFMIF